MATRFIQTLQFLVGLTMLVAGVAVVAPIAADWGIDPARHDTTGSGQPPIVGVQAAAAVFPHGHAIPDPRQATGDPALADSHVGIPNAALPGNLVLPARPVSAPYQPPQPAPRMATAFPGVVQDAPGLNATYRSTLAIPPPPLLDAHGPPPVAPGWTIRGPQAGDQRIPDLPPTPPTYSIRDGDDLTTLAIRFYGHPGAAAAILAANRDRLDDPSILPIGVCLRLPPPWAVTSGGAGSGPRAIEPGSGTSGMSAPRAHAAPPTMSHAWLSSPDATTP